MPIPGAPQPSHAVPTESVLAVPLPSNIMLEAIPEAIVVYDARGIITQTNSAYRQLWHLSPDDPLLKAAMGERLAHYQITDADGQPLLPEDWPVARLLRGEAVNGEAEQDMQARTFDGHTIWLSPRGTILRASDGTITGAVLTLRDVTARRQADAARIRAEEGQRQLEAIMHVLPAGVAIYDAGGRLVTQNPTSERITGRSIHKRERATNRLSRYGMRDIGGAPMPEAQSPSGRARRGETFTDLEAIVTDPTGKDRYLLTSGAPIRDARGTITGAVVVFQDVTQLYGLQREARDQRKLSDAIIESTPFGLAVFAPTDDFHCLRHNGPFLNLVGADWQARGDIVDVPLDDLFDADSAQRTRAVFESVRASGEAFFLPEYPAVLLPDPEPRWYKWSLTPLYDSVGTLTGLMVAAVEITEQVRARQAQEHQAARLQAVLDVLPTGVAIADAQGRTTDFNAAFRRLWGMGAPYVNSIAEYDAYRAWWPDGRPLDPDEWAMAVTLRTGAPVPDQEVEIATFDGQRRTVLNAAAPIRDPKTGAVLGGTIAIRDITALKQLEQRTQTSLDALLRMTQQAVVAGEDLPTIAHGIAQVTREVLACHRVGVIAIDPDTLRQSGLAVVGLTASEETRWWQEQSTAGRFGEGADPELLGRFMRGEPLVVDMTTGPYAELPNDYGITQALFIPLVLDERILGMLTLDYAGAAHDFTAQEIALARGVADLAALVLERERLQLAHAHTQARALALEATNGRMNTFLGIASHELRTPITSIKTSMQLANRLLSRLPQSADARARAQRQQMAEMLDVANNQVDRLNRFIADLLDVTHIQSGTIELTPRLVDLTAIVRDMVATQRLHWPERAIELTLPDDAVTVWGDPDRLGQVVTNLLTNPLKYAPPDQPIVVELRRDDDQARLSVTDHGPGLTPDQQERLFQAFGRIEEIQPLSKSNVGLGLGLFICKTIIAMHGGQIGVESQVGAGATFWFTLPLC